MKRKNGSYISKSEEITECYVECADEVAMFKLNSNQLYKILLSKTQKSLNYERYNIDKPVKSIEGELYTTIDGIEKAFNVSWNYDKDNMRMKILQLWPIKAIK